MIRLCGLVIWSRSTLATEYTRLIKARMLVDVSVRAVYLAFHATWTQPKKAPAPMVRHAATVAWSFEVGSGSTGPVGKFVR